MSGVLTDASTSPVDACMATRPAGSVSPLSADSAAVWMAGSMVVSTAVPGVVGKAPDVGDGVARVIGHGDRGVRVCRPVGARTPARSRSGPPCPPRRTAGPVLSSWAVMGPIVPTTWAPSSGVSAPRGAVCR